MAAFAQFERQNLIKRTKEGMEAARRRGKQIGRPYKLTHDQIIGAHTNFLRSNTTLTDLAKKLDCSRDTLTKGFKRLGLIA
jgi:DNA invertase Pin-like site-specific DNA recombinase